jgi:16S rRNA G527 N7-methylase RsmG
MDTTSILTQINQTKLGRVDTYRKRQAFLRRMRQKLMYKEAHYPTGRAHKFPSDYSRWVDGLDEELSLRSGSY